MTSTPYKSIFSLWTNKVESKTVPLFLLLLLSGCASKWEPNKADIIQPSTVEKNTLNLRFFGVSTMQISDGDNTLLVDGFFTRKSISYSLIHGIKSSKESVLATFQEFKIEEPTALLVAHAHYDHALDGNKTDTHF